MLSISLGGQVTDLKTSPVKIFSSTSGDWFDEAAPAKSASEIRLRRERGTLKSSG
jgi:hypothetical protein